MAAKPDSLWQYVPMRAPGTRQPSIWGSSPPNCWRVKNCRTMVGARLGAWMRNRRLS